MAYTAFINNRTLDEKIGTLLKSIGNGLNKEQFDKVVCDSLAKMIPSKAAMHFTSGIFDKIDSYGIKDGTITIEELNNYFNRNYSI